MFLEVLSDTLNALHEILVGRVPVHAKPTGYLDEGEVFIEAEVDDAAVRLFQLFVHVGCNVVEPFQSFVNGL